MAFSEDPQKSSTPEANACHLESQYAATQNLENQVQTAAQTRPIVANPSVLGLLSFATGIHLLCPNENAPWPEL